MIPQSIPARSCRSVLLLAAALSVPLAAQGSTFPAVSEQAPLGPGGELFTDSTVLRVAGAPDEDLRVVLFAQLLVGPNVPVGADPVHTQFLTSYYPQLVETAYSADDYEGALNAAAGTSGYSYDVTLDPDLYLASNQASDQYLVAPWALVEALGASLTDPSVASDYGQDFSSTSESHIDWQGNPLSSGSNHWAEQPASKQPDIAWWLMDAESSSNGTSRILSIDGLAQEVLARQASYHAGFPVQWTDQVVQDILLYRWATDMNVVISAAVVGPPVAGVRPIEITRRVRVRIHYSGDGGGLRITHVPQLPVGAFYPHRFLAHDAVSVPSSYVSDYGRTVQVHLATPLPNAAAASGIQAYLSVVGGGAFLVEATEVAETNGAGEVTDLRFVVPQPDPFGYTPTTGLAALYQGATLIPVDYSGFGQGAFHLWIYHEYPSPY